jgi:transcriptional regulator with XRE-family HTH domain
MDKHFIKTEEGRRIGKLITEKRESLGWSLEYVADKFGTTRQNIRRYEIWDLKKPDMSLLEGIFEMLDLDKKIIPKPFKKSAGLVRAEQLLNQTGEIKVMVEEWRSRYFELLEKYTKLLEEKNKEQ